MQVAVEQRRAVAREPSLERADRGLELGVRPQRGGGARQVLVRRVRDPITEELLLIVHLVVDVCDAMGANLVNQMAEVLAPRVEELCGGRK